MSKALAAVETPITQSRLMASCRAQYGFLGNDVFALKFVDDLKGVLQVLLVSEPPL